MSLKPSQSGFTLLEILIAIVVLSLGMLGLAGLQAATLRNNQIAYYRAIAVQQTYDMADRIRANQAGVAAGAYDNLTAVTPADPDCVANVCTPANMAVADHSQWNTNNARMLPGGSGTVTTVGGGAFDIAVNWNENTEQGGGGQQMIMRVQP
ncbi:MAG: type IV pilus modification protein PilV [Thiobacillus sp. SCN 64-35]|nr:MAG: type IV pilus modification protein PilV [Thiobacillus sp. SCN 64-35]